jgi:hypothetical protein
MVLLVDGETPPSSLRTTCCSLSGFPFPGPCFDFKDESTSPTSSCRFRFRFMEVLPGDDILGIPLGYRELGKKKHPVKTASPFLIGYWSKIGNKKREGKNEILLVNKDLEATTFHIQGSIITSISTSSSRFLSCSVLFNSSLIMSSFDTSLP